MAMHCFIVSKPDSVSAYWRPEDLPDSLPDDAVSRAIQSPSEAVNMWGATSLAYVPVAGEPPAEYLRR